MDPYKNLNCRIDSIKTYIPHESSMPSANSVALQLAKPRKNFQELNRQ